MCMEEFGNPSESGRIIYALHLRCRANDRSRDAEWPSNEQLSLSGFCVSLFFSFFFPGLQAGFEIPWDCAATQWACGDGPGSHLLPAGTSPSPSATGETTSPPVKHTHAGWLLGRPLPWQPFELPSGVKKIRSFNFSILQKFNLRAASPVWARRTKWSLKDKTANIPWRVPTLRSSSSRSCRDLFFSEGHFVLVVSHVCRSIDLKMVISHSYLMPDQNITNRLDYNWTCSLKLTRRWYIFNMICWLTYQNNSECS